MANRASIEVIERKLDLWDVKVSDDYDLGNIVLFEKPPEDDVELLAVVAKIAKENSGCPQADRAHAIIDHVMECQKGIFIRDTWYNVEELRPALSKNHQS